MAPRLQISRAICQSREAEAGAVASEYLAILGRAPAPAEIQGWLDSGLGLDAFGSFLSVLLASTEAWNLCQRQPSVWLNRIYSTILHRPPDPAGLANWMAQLNGWAAAAQPGPIAATNPDGTPTPGGIVWGAGEVRNEQAIAAGPCNAVFLGDSITDWLSTGDGAAVWNASFSPLGSKNLAIAGLGTNQVLWQVQQGQVKALNPRAVVLMVGTNNLDPAVWGQQPPAVAQGIARICQEIQDQLPACRLLLLGIMPRGLANAPIRSAIQLTNTVAFDLVRPMGVTGRPMWQDFLAPDGSLRPGYFRPDNLHPATLGYAVYRNLVQPWLVEALK